MSYFQLDIQNKPFSVRTLISRLNFDNFPEKPEKCTTYANCGRLGRRRFCFWTLEKLKFSFGRSK